MVQFKRVDVGQGVAWIRKGWDYFMKNPGLWVVFSLVLIVGFVVVSLIPFVGGLVISLISPVLMAGWLFAVRETEQGRAIELAHMFRGFQESRALNGLLALGGVVVAGALVSGIIVALFVGGAMLASMHAGTAPVSGMALGAGALIGLLLVLAVELLVAMAVVYAVPLVMFDNAPVGEAMRASFNACVENFLPLLVFGVIYLILGIVATVPFGLGWLVLLPASAGMLYASYRDSFGA